MKYNISKELFETVCPDKTFNYVNHSDRIIFEFGHNKHQTYMYINDFFFKCKEWLENNNTLHDIVIYKNQVLFTSDLYAEGGIFCEESFEEEDIKQSLFKACQWILDNKDK